MSQLLEAIRAGNLQKTKQIIKSLPADQLAAILNQRDETKNTALHLAVSQNREDIVKVLLAAGADANQPNFYGATPLHSAAQKGYENIVKALLKSREIQVNQMMREGLAPLHYAAMEGHEKIARMLIVAGAEIRQTAGSCRLYKTPLDYAKTEALKEAMQKEYAKVKAKAENRKAQKETRRKIWNVFVSFLAGLTLIYPVVKLVQYCRSVGLWKKTAKISESKTTAAPVESTAVTFPDFSSWAKGFSLFYEYGLEGKWGAAHTQEEVRTAIPTEQQRQALKLKIA